MTQQQYKTEKKSKIFSFLTQIVTLDFSHSKTIIFLKKIMAA